jgi:AcrR family transcriptional regulator
MAETRVTDGAPAARIRRGRGRRPAAEVRAQVLEAAGTLFLETGMAGFTVEKVAARAGASRMTVHKWWSSRGALALEGYAAVVQHQLEFPDTGDVAADLTAQVLAFARLLRDPTAGRAIAELIGAAQTDPELAAAFRERYTGPRRSMAVQALHRAIDTGKLRADVDPQVVADQIWGACYNRLLVTDEPVTDDFARALVDNLMRGLR